MQNASLQNDLADIAKLLTIYRMDLILWLCISIQYVVVTWFQQAEPVRKKKAQQLLDTLPRRGKNAFETFIRALCESDQNELAELLDEQLYRKYRTSPQSDSEEEDISEISPREDVIKKILLTVGT